MPIRTCQSERELTLQSLVLGIGALVSWTRKRLCNSDRPRLEVRESDIHTECKYFKRIWLEISKNDSYLGLFRGYYPLSLACWWLREKKAKTATRTKRLNLVKILNMNSKMLRYWARLSLLARRREQTLVRTKSSQHILFRIRELVQALSRSLIYIIGNLKLFVSHPSMFRSDLDQWTGWSLTFKYKKWALIIDSCNKFYFWRLNRAKRRSIFWVVPLY